MRTVNQFRLGRHVRLATVLALLTLLVPAAGFGQGTKVGMVDLQRVVEQSADYLVAAEEWTARFEERSADFQATEAEALAEQEKLDATPNTLTEAERNAVIRNVDRLQRQLTRMNEDIQVELDGLREELMMPIAEKADGLIRVDMNTEGMYEGQTVRVMLFDQVDGGCG